MNIDWKPFSELPKDTVGRWLVKKIDRSDSSGWFQTDIKVMIRREAGAGFYTLIGDKFAFDVAPPDLYCELPEGT